FLRAPDLLRAVRIAAEGGDAGGTGDRCVDPVDRTRSGMRDAVGVDEEVADAGTRELHLEPGLERAFGEPEAVGRAPEEAAILGDRDLDLRARGPRRHAEQRKEAVRRGAGDDLDQATLLVGTERGDEVLLPLVEEDRAGAVEAGEVHLRDPVKARVGPGP